MRKKIGIVTLVLLTTPLLHSLAQTECRNFLYKAKLVNTTENYRAIFNKKNTSQPEFKVISLIPSAIVDVIQEAEEKETYCKVCYEGKTGYISKHLVERLDKEKTNLTPSGSYLYKAKFANTLPQYKFLFRNRNTNSYDTITPIETFETVYVLKDTELYFEVFYNGYTGFINQNLLIINEEHKFEMLLQNARTVTDWNKIAEKNPDYKFMADSKIKSLILSNAYSVTDWVSIANRYPDQKIFADKKAFEAVGDCSVQSIKSYLDNFPNGMYRSQVSAKLNKAFECESLNSKTQSSTSDYKSSSSSSNSSNSDCKVYAYFTKTDEDDSSISYDLRFYYENSLLSGDASKIVIITYNKDNNRFYSNTYSSDESSYSNKNDLIDEIFHNRVRKSSGCNRWTYLER